MKYLITTNEIAEIFSLSERRIQQLTKEGVLKNTSRGKYNLKESIKDFIKYKIELSRSKYSSCEIDISEARRRKEVAEAELKEIELKKTKEELVSEEEVIENWIKLLSIVKTRLLAMPNKLAPMLIGVESIGEIKEYLSNEVIAALNEMANK